MRRDFLTYYGRKLFLFAASIMVLSVVVFYIARLAPGDPLVSYYGDRVEKMSPEEREWAMEKLGLDAPVSVQYVRWLGHAVHGDFGISYKYRQDVPEVISRRVGNTLLLGGTGFILIFALALGAGIFCVWFEGRLPDRILCRAGTVTSCIPEFWLSLVLILVFAVSLRILPGSGAYSAGKPDDIADRVRHLILPLTVVVMNHLWYYAYMIRNRLLEEVRADYVLFAKSKGLGKREILLRHCLRGALPSYLSIMAISVPHVLGGTYIVEMVFSYPGLGTLAYESARYQDYNLLMVLSLLSGMLVIFCNMLSQIVNERIDPRIRAGEEVRRPEGGGRQKSDSRQKSGSSR